MKQKGNLLVLSMSAAAILSVLAVGACSRSNNPSPTPAPGGGAVVQSDSIVTVEIRAIRAQTTGYPWEVDVLVQTSDSVGSLPNPTKDKVGQVITAKADEDLASFKVGQTVNARVKYVGDVPLPGISLYIYDLKAK